MAKKEIVDFKCVPIRCLCDKENFKMYACDLIETEDDVKKNNFGNITISGNVHDLGVGVEYTIRAEEQYNQTYKYSYKVISVERDVPTDSRTTRLFLNEILTPNQTEVLINAYPNIVEKVMNDDLEDVDLSKTKGIKDKTFNVIKRKILENFSLSKLFKEFDGLIDFNVLKKLSEKYPSANKIKQELSKDPYKCLCGLSRIAFKKADGILLEMERNYLKLIEKGIEPPIVFDGDLKTSTMRMKSAIIFVLDKNETEGNTKISLSKLKTECNKLAPQCKDKFKEAVKGLNNIKVTKEGFIANIKTYEKEAYTCGKIFEALKNPKKWKIDVEKYRKTDGGELTDDQLSMLKGIQENNIYMLIGYSGTGKSYSTQQLIKMLDDNRKNYIILAPTGRASKVIGNYTKRPASTIHRGLSYNPMDGWGNNYSNKLFVDVVIVDESSMKDIELFYRLIDAIDFRYTKLLLIGDPAQLPSVGCGNVLHDLVDSKIIPMTMLTQVFRYGVGGISTVATQIRQMEDYIPRNISKPVTIGEDKGFTFIPSAKQNIVKNCVSLYKKLLTKYTPDDIMVLSAFNKGDYGTKILNQYLQRIANGHNINKNAIKSGEKSDTTFYYNDLVIQCVNNYDAELFEKYMADMDRLEKEDFEPIAKFIANGETGKIDDIHSGNKECKISFDEDIRYDKEMLNTLKLAYSISVHKSQGGQAKVVILLTPSSHKIMLNSNLIYVGVTRAQLKCFQIGEPKVALDAIKKKENFKRETNMSHLLKNEDLSTKEMHKFIKEYQSNIEKDNSYFNQW